ncbi:putative ribosome biogenesis GTPase RsgA 2 [Fulvitalea axinellae]|uniref:Small ribosomal subunit biogenesis GTPase RsgA n=1 Tax=Fulvitalea axinellae TaxID=1182444 RepID=A0AAU9CLY1_9BACT|nr:putative ribosome biogenesis GTPase RsgA 2 [Fulvitalea axinellae]
MMEGLVLRSTGSWYEVETAAGDVYNCRLRGKFKIKGLKVTNPIAVGDRVKFELEDSEEQTGVIQNIVPRENYIIRQSSRKVHYGHIIAANLDQAILVVTLVMPRTSFGFIDRFLVSAESYHVPAVLAFNKSDLLEEEDKEYQSQVMAMYERIGYKCVEISALEGTGVEDFEKMLKGKVSLLAGHSGVGKSTLTNRIDPEIGQRTAEISQFANKGVHTTTFAEMFKLEEGTYLIDTPGIKELALFEFKSEDIAQYFPEMREYASECRFHNCTHDHEPGCAVRKAVKAGKISLTRFDSYMSMLKGDDNRR